MSYCVRAGELLAALYNAGMKHEAEGYEAAMSAIVNMMADTIAAKFDLNHTKANYSCGMVAVCFSPKTPGQPIPHCLAAFDSEEEWDVQPKVGLRPAYGGR